MSELDSAPPAVATPVYGGFWRRVFAYLLDEVILVILCVVIALLIAVPTVILVTVLGRELDPRGTATSWAR